MVVAFGIESEVCDAHTHSMFGEPDVCDRNPLRGVSFPARTFFSCSSLFWGLSPACIGAAPRTRVTLAQTRSSWCWSASGAQLISKSIGNGWAFRWVGASLLWGRLGDGSPFGPWWFVARPWLGRETYRCVICIGEGLTRNGFPLQRERAGWEHGVWRRLHA